ncbi:MAG TPA: protoporphyrinogen oxidase [Thermoanaerobaculia bacterium]|nr:protoporphyrinogen oxidase [Thermoanaerobaculia bacterium]
MSDAAPGHLHDVAVLGAGITGLTAAFHLARGGADVVVLEAAGRVGGVIESRRHDTATGRFLFEAGPNTVLDGRPAVGELLAAAGLGDERLSARPAAKRRYVWKRGRLVALPSGPGSFLTTPLFSPVAKLRLAAEPFVGRPGDGAGEESIADFVRRRLGGELLRYAVGPFISGVYAGDPERLSMRWAVPRLYALEAEHGGLIRGMLARGRQARRARKAGGGERAAGGPSGPGGTMLTFADGLETLPRRLAREIGAAGGEVRTGRRVHALLPAEGGYVAETGDGPVRARRVVVTVPAPVAADLLDHATGGDARPLAEIPYSPVAVAHLGVRLADLDHPLDGFGFLAPRDEGLRILGCLFTSTIFPGRAPEGHAALAVFVGGRTDPAAVELPEAELRELVLGDLNRALGLRGEPVVEAYLRWPQAIPQYELGHGSFVELAEELERRLPGLTLAGNWRGGVSVPDRIEAGAGVAEAILG